MRNKGKYAGTLRMDRQWFSRLIRNGALGGRGAGEYWYDYKGFYFVHEGTSRGLVIPLDSIIDVTLGRCHGLSFSSGKILKIIWRQGGEKLSSGFVVERAEQLRDALTTRGWA